MTWRNVVLDTNVVISALLFRGPTSALHALWKKKAFTIAASKEIVQEYVKVLAYPKFKLSENEIKSLMQEELLPYMEPVVPARARAPDDSPGACSDPDDNKFLACAEAAKADVIVSGDLHLLSLRKHKGRPIVTVQHFLRKFK